MITEHETLNCFKEFLLLSLPGLVEGNYEMPHCNLSLYCQKYDNMSVMPMETEVSLPFLVWAWPTQSLFVCLVTHTGDIKSGKLVMLKLMLHFPSTR